ncbi:hypothetical protein ABB37_04000 [Leptomonas pyrrhocoris]|uniref:Rab3-GAP regulatory subunit N-terminal domain-containing protein n=1 Tax=Leptomonas pyrrhocoris TaxID=157538 RepID=A0A0M9G3M7_LEPPY|nr:hypothetical protein ABB37_04000 [Leptomonas pyrrhocoris]KPA81695.1 hypothetical protein ABB37_04000 [Leptomonas pyrrhocoris]|eukprot:XP_015660134.1 hypothetical protein ABB37_04000 [Leptomonas pyrrhocoris]
MSTATTPVELVTVGRVPARERGLFTGVAPSVVEVFPSVFLIASIVRTKNQCILELVQPAGKSAAATNTTTVSPALNSFKTNSSRVSPSSSSLPEVQRRLCEADGVPRGPTHPTSVAVPFALKAGFRVPRVIHLVAEDEGVIETVTLVRDPLGAAFVAALEEEDRATSVNPLRDTAAAGAASSIPSVHLVHIHFFIGTSNGTVIVGNALRGTILAVAQFQYHHLFSREARGGRSTTTSTAPLDGGTSDGEAEGAQGDSKRSLNNQAVVKFVVREKREEQLWNPSLPFSQENNIFVSQDGSVLSKKAAAADAASPTVGSRVASVYVVHSGGKVVELTRAALDAFVRSSVDRLDGRRPHLILEWDADTSASSFPVAGPASDFAAHIGHIFVLEPPSSNSPIEEHTATSKSASPQSTLFSIRDADILTEMPEATALLAPLEAQRRPFESLLIGGSSPLFSFYRLQPHSSGFSASNAVKAVKNMVTGVARTLWFSALGTTSPIERPPHLKKIPTPDTRRFLQADAKCVALQIDPSQQYAVFAVEGGGRIYVAEVQTGVISGVLKGCRAAQFTWWWVDSAAGRPALLLIVYLPLRRAVEVYTPRTWERLAACHVPEGCVLLRTCGVPRERCDDAGASRGLLSGGKLAPSVCSGCGSDALLMDPAGTVYAIRVGWVLKDIVGNASFLQPMPSLSAGEATTTSTSASDEAALLSSSVLRACQTPDDFVELALQLPLPQPRVVWEDSVAPTSPAEDGSSSGDTAAVVKAYAVKGGDEVRQYSKSLELLCHTVQRRFAPGYAEIFVAAMPCTPQLVLEGSAAAVPHNMTAAQCLHYVRTYRSLTENYYRLLSCRRVAPSRYFDPAQWTSGLITPELWKETFSTADSAATVAFVRHMEERMEALLAAFPAELHVFKKYFAAHLYQVLRKVPSLTTAAASATPCALADPASFMPLATFLHCFYCGTTRPSFLCDAIEAAEDADGSINFLGPFSDLAFGKLGLNSFFAQLPVLTELGCTDGDVAVLTVTWISRQGGRNLCSLLSSTTVGLLVAILLSFSDGDFLFALDRAPIPFISVDGDIATNTAANSITSLLWCCAVRCALRPSTSFITGQHFTRRVRQLLQLWYSLTKGVAPPAAASAPASDPISSPCTDARIAFSLRLGSVEPPSLPLTSTASVAASAADSSGLRSRAVQTEGDAFEVYLQRNGISVSLLDDYVIPRADADAEAVRNLPLFYTFISSLGATENVRSRSSGACDSPDVVESLPWIDSHKWDQERFRNDVTKPLENLWLQLTSSATGKSKSRSLKTTLRGAAADDESRQSVYTSCLLLVAMSVLEHATRPLTDVAFFFWDNNAIPDGNLFPVDGAPEGLILFGSRTSREYLKSVQKLAALIESMLQQAVAPLGNADRVRLIQQINMALSEDDALLFPLVPSFLRTRLTILMQVLAQAPHAPLRRVQRVSRLVSLLLFFSEASALTMGGVALTQLQSQMAVPWKELIGGANRRDQLRLLPDVFIAEVNLPSPSQPALAQGAGLALSAYAMEDEQPTSAPLDVGVAVAVMRRFLVAGSVLYGQQRGNLPSPSSAPAAAAAVFTPTPYLGLVADDTRQCLTRLAHCLGLHEAWSDVADIVLMDYEIKHLFPVAAIEQEMLLLSTKSAAPRIGVSLLQCYLVQVLQHVTTQRKGHRQRGDRAAFEVSSDNLRRLVDALSAESRAWLQQRETEMMAADTEGKAAGTEMSHTRLSSPGSSTGVIASADSLPMGDAGWVTVTEFEDMRRLVLSTLGLPKGTPERKNFFQVLFTLSQWACEGRLTLPAPLQRIARELPQVVEKWEKIV